MKKLLSLVTLTIFLQVTTMNAQPVPVADPEGFVTGQVLLADNSTIAGTVKDNIRKKGEVTIIHEGKKTKYKASDITSVQIGNSSYITNNYTFYELIWQGNTMSLFRKANEPSGVQYNGTEPVVIANSAGVIDDLFIKKTTDPSFYLITKKNVKEVLGQFCSSCATTIDPTKFDITTIKKAVEDCDKCK